MLVPRKPDYPPKWTPPGGGPPHAAGRRLRSSAAERRRRNLTYLASFIIVTFVLGLIPALRFLLFLNVVGCVLLVAYLGAAMYFAARPPEPTRRRPETDSSRAGAAPTEQRPGPIPHVAGAEAVGGWYGGA